MKLITSVLSETMAGKATASLAAAQKAIRATMLDIAISYINYAAVRENERLEQHLCTVEKLEEQLANEEPHASADEAARLLRDLAKANALYDSTYAKWDHYIDKWQSLRRQRYPQQNVS
jgi:hypothetical protein